MQNKIILFLILNKTNFRKGSHLVSSFLTESNGSEVKHIEDYVSTLLCTNQKPI